MIPEIIIHGSVWGGVLALMALGFSLIFGVARVINLAHGVFYMFTAYLMYSLLFLGYGPSIIVSLPLIILVSIFIYRLLIHPLREMEVNVLVLTFAIAIFFEEFVKRVWGPEFKSIPYLVKGSITLLGVRVVSQKLLTFVVAVVLVSGLWLFTRRTKLGKAVRAVAQDMDVASLMGINAERVFMLSMGISALLAGFAAVLFAPVYVIEPAMGWAILMASFPVVILGGLGSIEGSIIAAFIIAFTEKIVEFTLGGGYLTQMVTLAVIVATLLLKPSGLFGKPIE